MITPSWIRIAPGTVVLAALVSLGCGPARNSLAPEAAARGEAATLPAAALDEGAEFDSRDDTEAIASARAVTGPATIAEPGHYRLAGDFEVTSGDGIVVTASDVRLWLGDHRIVGPGHKLGRGIVVQNARNVSVRGGRIERFGIGVQLSGTMESAVRGVQIQGGDETADPGAGNPPQIGILLVQSARNRVDANHVKDVNLGLFVRGGESEGNRIRRNHVEAGRNGLLAICYNPAPGAGPAGPHGDRVSLNVLSRFGTGISASAQSAGNLFDLNTIRYFHSAYEDLNGTNTFSRNRAEPIDP